MKHLTRTLVVFILFLSPQALMAQDAGAWVRVTSADEQFTAEMPEKPEIKKQRNSYGKLYVDAEVYTAADNLGSYSLWYLKNISYTRPQMMNRGKYLDECADLVWESLLEPERDKLPKRPGISARMTYEGELPSESTPGRRYSILLGNVEGVTYFYVAEDRIYVLAILNAPHGDSAERFIKSFAIRDGKSYRPPSQGMVANSTQSPVTGVGRGGGFGPGRGSSSPGGGPVAAAPSSNSTDYDRIFTSREVTQKARIISRPEPSYTESARKYGVQGTVVIRAVFSREGEVTNIKAVMGLPHGLTEKAIEAARLIQFIPAQKDGRAVGQYIQIEYNFNLY